jgi:THO complex subunit 1
MYLSSVYPLSERSGVNLHGDFNKDNVTHYEGEGIEDDDDMMTEEGGEGVSEEEKEARFYRRFWGMQKFLSNPPSMFGEGNFERLRTGVEATLAKFEKIGTGEVREAPAPSRPQESASRKRKQRPDDKGLGKAETFFFPKFLTSPKVFDLEVGSFLPRDHESC